MAQWIGPTFSLACVLAIGTPGIAAPASNGTEPFPPDTSAASASGGAKSPLPYSSNDDQVQRATYRSPADARLTSDNSPRAAASPLSNRAESMPINSLSHDNASGDKGATHGVRHEPPPAPSSAPALLSMLGSLAIVLGLFFGLVWFLRRGMPKATRLVSSEVVEVLGRAPLGGRQQMHVVRFGNKLLLVTLSPGGAETLSEITEPAEVDRLAGICQQSHANSATNTFRQVFRQFSEDRSFDGVRNRSSKSTTDLSNRKAAAADVMEDDDV